MEVFPKLSFGPAPKSATIEDLKEKHNVFVNLRTHTETSHWYCTVDDDDEEEEHIYISFPIPNRELPKTPELLKVCAKIVNLVQNGHSVYIHDVDGVTNGGPMVLGCYYWLKKDPKLDPIKDMRARNEYLLCADKEQVKQLAEIKMFAQKQWRWGGWGFTKK